MGVTHSLFLKHSSREPLFQDAADISLSMYHGNDLKRRCLWPVHNCIIRISGQRPETQGTVCEVGPGMASNGSFGNKSASVVDCLFYAVGGFFVGLGHERPEVEYICFGNRRKNIAAHLLVKRQSSFIA